MSLARIMGYELLNLNEIQIYSVEEGNEYNIHIYTVSITFDQENEDLTITSIGILFS